MNVINLMACPFCGGTDAEVFCNGYGPLDPSPFEVICVGGCGAVGPRATSESLAISAWNNRPKVPGSSHGALKSA